MHHFKISNNLNVYKLITNYPKNIKLNINKNKIEYNIYQRVYKMMK
jgi:hypothetical protein